MRSGSISCRHCATDDRKGFSAKFGAPLFDYARVNPRYRAIFNRAMTSYSAVETQWALTALANEDFSQIHTLCDVGGGHGHLACGLLNAYPHLQATVLDLPGVVGETDQLWAPKLGLSDRCRYLGGDMFHEVPPADAYVLKSVLHDWSDDECMRILANLRRAVVGAGRVFAADFVVPGPEEPHFSKLFDIHMMLVGTGRERTAAEFAELMGAAGWRYACGTGYRTLSTVSSPRLPPLVLRCARIWLSLVDRLSGLHPVSQGIMATVILRKAEGDGQARRFIEQLWQRRRVDKNGDYNVLARMSFPNGAMGGAPF